MKTQPITNRIALLCGLALLASTQSAFAQKKPAKVAKALKQTPKAVASTTSVARASVAKSTIAATQSALSAARATGATHAAVRLPVATNIAAGVERQARVKLQGTTLGRTPDKVLTDVETFIEEHNRFPSQSAETPAERSLRIAVDNAIINAKDPQNPTIVRLSDLKKQWGRKNGAKKTPDEILANVETFIRENNRYPSYTDLAERPLRQAADDAIKSAKDPQNPTIERLLDLEEEWVKLGNRANRAAKLAEKQLSTSGVETEEYIEQLMRFYDKLDPLESGFIE